MAKVQPEGSALKDMYKSLVGALTMVRRTAGEGELSVGVTDCQPAAQ